MVIIKSSKNNPTKFTQLIPYDKALTHVKEGGATVLNENTIVKLHSRDQLRTYIFKRDNGKCHYCGRKGFTLDHKTPRSKGGCSTPKNLVCCCRECNQNKGNLGYKEFLMKINHT
jgi:CRISPR/Cas system Type II protein with McrA/HNH and RuvC-like nuclease domain